MEKYKLYVVHYQFEELGVGYRRNVTAESEEQAVEYLVDYLSQFSNYTINILGVERFKPYSSETIN